MHTFKDAAGREWHVEITVQTLRDVRKMTGVDLNAVLACILNGKDDGAGTALFGDPYKFFDVLWVICAEQAAKHRVDDEAFGKGFDAATWEGAQEALLGALLFFSPDPRVREARVKMVETGKRLGELTLIRAQKELAEIDLEKTLDSLLATSSSKSGAAPVNAESSRGLSPSGSSV